MPDIPALLFVVFGEDPQATLPGPWDADEAEAILAGQRGGSSRTRHPPSAESLTATGG